jgi:hypothetical protein
MTRRLLVRPGPLARALAMLLVLAGLSGCLAPDPAVTFGDGLYVIGRDVGSGRYRVRVRPAGCYWARLRTNSPDAVIANGAYSGYFVVVDILPTDAAFQSTNCGTWSNDLSTVLPSGHDLRDGIFIVGTDLGPGRYRATGGPNCYWARLRGFSGDVEQIIENDSPSVGHPEIDILATDVGFESLDCGIWTRLSGPPTHS